MKGTDNMATKTPKEQQAALMLVGQKAAEFVVNWHIKPSGSDVAFLAAAVPNARQIVSADPGGDYDIWDQTGTKLLEANVTFEQAVTTVVTDYKTHKVGLIMTRLVGKHWRQAKHRELVERVMAEVCDISAERLRSELKAPHPKNN